MTLFNFTDKTTLFLPGCYSLAFLSDKVENYKKILKKLDIRPVISDNFFCCAGSLLEAGYEKEARKIAKENHALLKERGITKIVTSCALCYKTLTQDYKEIVPNWDIQTEFILEIIFNKLKKNIDLIKNTFLEEIAYYDSCYFGRYLHFYDVPRDLIMFLGYKLVELPYKKEETLCCGGCGNLLIANKDLADKIAEDFIKMLKRRDIKKVITADLQAYRHLKDYLKNSSIKDIEIIDFSDLLCKTLNIRPEVIEEEEGGRIENE